MTLDCKSCGACCVGGYEDGEGFAYCSTSDVKRLSRSVRHRLHVSRLGPMETVASLSTPAVMTEDFGKICGFLRGTPGRRVSCGIYDTRPNVCQNFRPGSKNCVSARTELGL